MSGNLFRRFCDFRHSTGGQTNIPAIAFGLFGPRNAGAMTWPRSEMPKRQNQTQANGEEKQTPTNARAFEPSNVRAGVATY